MDFSVKPQWRSDTRSFDC